MGWRLTRGDVVARSDLRPEFGGRARAESSRGGATSRPPCSDRALASKTPCGRARSSFALPRPSAHASDQRAPV